MAIAFRSSSNTTYATRTNTTVTAPAGIQNGDFLVAQLLQGASNPPAAPSAPSGWTQIGTAQTAVGGGFDVRIQIYYKIAASESGNYTWTHGNMDSQGMIACYSGAHATTPFHTHSSRNESPANTTCTADSVTTTVNNCMLAFIEWNWADTANNLSPPTGMTERIDVATALYVADVIQASAGASGTKSHTCNAASGNPRGAWLVAIAPPASPKSLPVFSRPPRFRSKRK